MTDRAGVVVTNSWGDCEVSATSACQTESITVPNCTTSSGPRPGQDCVFPFRYKGTWHNGCTDVDRGGGDSGSKWCATRVNRRTKEMLDNFWGVCQMSSCPTDGEDTD